MIPLTCLKCQSSFSAYLDGDVSGQQMHKIVSHLENCAVCEREFAAWRTTQQTISSIGKAKAPSDLALRLRLAISHEHSKRKSSWIDTVSLKWNNTARPIFLQVSAGFAGTIALVGSIALLLGLFAAPEPVMANDEPLGAMTSPHYLYSSVNPHAILTDHDGVIVVEASVNSEGKVYDYRIVSGPESSAVQSQVVDQLLTSVFQPASVFGSPVRGRVVLTFSGISVHG